MREHRIDRPAVGRGLPPGNPATGGEQGLRLMAAGPGRFASIWRRLDDEEARVAGGKIRGRQLELTKRLTITDDADIGPADQVAEPDRSHLRKHDQSRGPKP